MGKNYYDILGIAKSANESEIKKAYRKLAHKYHPDKKGGDEAKFKEVNEAYQVLSDPQKRSQYDQFGPTFNASSGGGFSSQGFSFEDIFGQSGGFSFGGNTTGFEDIFSDVFGGARGGQGRSRRGKDIHIAVTISLSEAHEGVSRSIKLDKQSECHTCHGSGAEPGSSMETCNQCQGSGFVTQQVQTMLGTFAQKSVCSRCHGKGKVPQKICHTCHGSGVVRKSEEVQIEIPAGVSTGQTLEVPGRGEAAAYGGRSGALYVSIEIESDSRFIRKGDDLYLTEYIPFSLLILGGKMSVKTLDKEVVLKIPKQTQSGEVFRLRGKGVNRLYKRGQGDLYVTLQAKTPEKLSAKQRTILKTLKDVGL